MTHRIDKSRVILEADTVDTADTVAVTIPK